MLSEYNFEHLNFHQNIWDKNNHLFEIVGYNTGTSEEREKKMQKKK